MRWAGGEMDWCCCDCCCCSIADRLVAPVGGSFTELMGELEAADELDEAEEDEDDDEAEEEEELEEAREAVERADEEPVDRS